MAKSIGPLPSRGQKSALAGSFGTPGSSNVFVTDTDPALTPAAPVTAFGGTGALGNVTIASSASMNGVFDYNNLTINGGVTITINATTGLWFRCLGNYVNSGTINGNGAGLTGGAAGSSPGDGSTGAGGDAQAGSSLGGGGSGGSDSHVGGDGSFSLLGQAVQSGSSTNGTNGVSVPSYFGALSVFGLLLLPGGGGGGGSAEGSGGFPATGGAGGAGGGVFGAEVVGNVTEGTVHLNGVNGGSGSGTNGFEDWAGGGGGGGGTYALIYGGSLTTGTVQVNGGAAGAGWASGNPVGGTGGTGSIRRFAV